MSTMTKEPKKPGKRGRPEGRKVVKPLHFEFPPEVVAAWEDYLASIDPKPTSKSAALSLFTRFLKDKGFLPRPQQPADD